MKRLSDLELDPAEIIAVIDRHGGMAHTPDIAADMNADMKIVRRVLHVLEAHGKVFSYRIALKKENRPGPPLQLLKWEAIH